MSAEIDVAALQANKAQLEQKLDTPVRKAVWDRDDAPPGSTAGSLLVYERGEPVRVSGPTHYQHLADGRVIGGYNGGTHYTEPGENEGDPDRVIPILAIHGG